MTITQQIDWQPHARRLADELTAAGKLTDPAWRRAVQEVPRHQLVPVHYQRDDSGAWRLVDTSNDLAMVYSNTVLLTKFSDTDAGEVLLSSSSQPGLMVRMLEALDVHDQQRVLEIGTGSGYNAALLCHRLGEANVFSIDVEPELVHSARSRLAELGYRPTLVAADGALGLPQHAPFDRIIASCAVRSVPWAWVEQTRVDGVILTDLKTNQLGGSLVRLVRRADRAEGRFDPTYAAFMYLRHHAGNRDEQGPWTKQDRTHGECRVTSVDPRTPWSSLIVWFLASLELGPDVCCGYTGLDTTRPPTAVSISTADGSWAEVALEAQNGSHVVTEGGPSRLWCVVERAQHLWQQLGRPGWHRFGLTVTPERQTVWFDNPDSSHSWDLPSCRR